MAKTSYENQEHQEGIMEIRDVIHSSMSEDDLVKVVDNMYEDARELHGKMKDIQERNNEYWMGNQLDPEKLRRTNEFTSSIVLNKVFQSLETIIPRLVSRIPSPMVTVPKDKQKEDKEKIRKKIDLETSIEKYLIAKAKRLHIGNELKEFARFFHLNHIAAIKFGYDETDGFWFENIDPRRLYLPDRYPIDFVIETREDTIRSLIDKFPDKEEQIMKLVGTKQGQKQIHKDSIVGYLEVTTDSMKVFKLSDVILYKEDNRYYDFNDKENNHWTKPRMDYIFSDMWTLKSGPYAKTTLVSQIISLQDSVNKRKRQISDNADQANGLLVGYGQSGISKAEISELKRNRKDPYGAVYLDSAAPGAMQEFGGKQLQPYVFEDMTHTISEIDNIAGTHATIRGEKTPGEETFGGRQLLKEGDEGRISDMVNMIERVAEQLYVAMVQILKLHPEEIKKEVYVDEKKNREMVSVTEKQLESDLNVHVEIGSTLVKDKAVLSEEAIRLWQMGGIDPITLFERIGDPTPYRTAERLMTFQTKPQELFEELDETLQEDNQNKNKEMITRLIIEAGQENARLINGEAVAPNEDAIMQHINVHEEMLSSMREAGEVDEETIKVIREHVEKELDIAEENAKLLSEEQNSLANAGQKLSQTSSSSQ